MNCPYCSQKMQEGAYRTQRDGPIIWLPSNVKYKGLFFSRAKVEEQGGIVLGNAEDEAGARKIGYACKSCGILITKF